MRPSNGFQFVDVITPVVTRSGAVSPTTRAIASMTPADGGATDLGFAMEIRGSFITSFMEPMIAGAAGGEIDASIARIQGRFAGTA